MSTLSKYEMACLTAQVPGTEDPKLNQIISTSLRLKIGAELLKAMVSNPGFDGTGYEILARMAIGTANIYLRAFESLTQSAAGNPTATITDAAEKPTEGVTSPEQ